MKVHEYQAKSIFSQYDIPVERHILCSTADEAVEAYRQWGAAHIVIKAQVLTGGRGKAGGIKLAKSEEAVRLYAEDILNMTIKDLPVTRILLSEAVDIVA